MAPRSGRLLLLAALLQLLVELTALPSIGMRVSTTRALQQVRPRCARTLLCAAPPAAPSQPAAPSAKHIGNRPKILLGALVLIYISNQWSRALPASLVSFSGGGTGREFMNIALNMDAVRYGWLSSYAFTALYALTSLAAGAACDTFSRGRVLLVAAGGWSLATGLQACASSYNQLLVSRAALGIAQAFCSPAAYPMIGQAFTSDTRGVANAVYSSGLYVGYALASLSAVLSRSQGWRQTSMIVAGFSFFSTALLGVILRLHWPSSGAVGSHSEYPTATAEVGPTRATARRSTGDGDGPATMPLATRNASTMAARKSPARTVLGTRSASLLLAASMTRSFGGYAVGAWSVPFFRHYHPALAADFAVANGIFIAIAGSLSTVVGGWLSDQLVSRGGKGAPADGSTAHRALYVPICGSLLAIPFWICVLQSRAFAPAMIALMFSYLVAECWFGAMTSTMQGALPQVCSLWPSHASSAAPIPASWKAMTAVCRDRRFHKSLHPPVPL